MFSLVTSWFDRTRGRGAVLALSALMVLGLVPAALAQTNPPAQTLPYAQNFGTTTFTTMPTGMAAWGGLNGATVTTQALAEASVPNASATLTAATIATTTGGTFGFAVSSNARPYVQTSGNATAGVNQLALAINTTGLTNITVGYDVEIISAQPRTVGIVMQYRVGTAGAWTTVAGANNPFSQAGGTTGVKASPSLTLPAAAEGQAVVQLRWATWRGTETGNSSGIAIDNVSVSGTSAVIPPAPISAAATLVTSSSFQANWAASAGATSYRLDVATDAGFTSFVPGFSDLTIAGTSQSVTGLSASTNYFYRVRASNLSGTSGNSGTITVATSAPPVAEPTVQASAVTFSAVGSNDMTVNWTNGDGASRIVVAKAGGPVTGTPTDNISYTASATFGGGSTLGAGEFVVFKGSGSSVAVSGLAGGTTYQFAVFEFNGTAGSENYLITGPGTGSQATTAATYSWNGGASASWAAAGSWSPSRATPASSDILQFTGGGTVTATNVPSQTEAKLIVSGGTIVNLQANAAATVLTLSGGAGALSVASGSELNINGANAMSLAIAAGSTGSVNGSMTLSAGVHTLTAADASGVTFAAGAVFTQGVGCTGNVFGSTGTASTVVFANGSTMNQLAGSNPFALTQPSSKVVFQSGSLFSLQQATAPALSGRTYGNFEYKAAGSVAGSGASALAVDNLTVSLGSLSIGMTGAFNVKGNISVASGATLNLNPGAAATLTLSGTSPQSLSSAGTLTIGANQSFAVSNPSGVTLNGPFTLPASLTLSGGDLTLSGGDLTVNSSLALGVNRVLTGPSKLVLPAGAALTRTSGYVVGNLQKNVATGGPVARTFEIGDASNYTPASLTFASVTAAGNIVGSTAVPGTLPAQASLSTSKFVNRSWTLTNSGVAFTTYDATLNFVAADIQGGGDPNSFLVAKNTGGTFTLPTMGVRTPTSTQATGMTSLSDFYVGETQTFTITASAGANGSISPSGVTVVNSGGGQTYTITPNAGYLVQDVLVDAVSVGAVTS